MWKAYLMTVTYNITSIYFESHVNAVIQFCDASSRTQDFKHLIGHIIDILTPHGFAIKSV